MSTVELSERPSNGRQTPTGPYATLRLPRASCTAIEYSKFELLARDSQYDLDVSINCSRDLRASAPACWKLVMSIK